MDPLRSSTKAWRFWVQLPKTTWWDGEQYQLHSYLSKTQNHVRLAPTLPCLRYHIELTSGKQTYLDKPITLLNILSHWKPQRKISSGYLMPVDILEYIFARYVFFFSFISQHKKILPSQDGQCCVPSWKPLLSPVRRSGSLGWSNRV